MGGGRGEEDGCGSEKHGILVEIHFVVKFLRPPVWFVPFFVRNVLVFGIVSIERILKVGVRVRAVYGSSNLMRCTVCS